MADTKFTDITTTRSLVTEPAIETDVTANKLLRAMCSTINELGYFYTVGPQLRDEEITKCPGCIVVPGKIQVVSQGMSGVSADIRYAFDIAFALKHPNDAILVQQALFYSEKIRQKFMRAVNGGLFVYAAVPGHYNTEIQASNIGETRVIGNGVLAYSSGINIVFWVWEPIA